jgi:hypothetical protein
MTFIPNNDWNTVYGGPGSRIDLDSYWSTKFLNSILRSKIRKDKIKKIFNVDGKEK